MKLFERTVFTHLTLESCLLKVHWMLSCFECNPNFEGYMPSNTITYSYVLYHDVTWNA